MPSSDVVQRAGRRSGWWRVAFVVAAIVAAGLAALYVASPWIAAALAPRLAGSLGLDELRLATGRPGLTGLTVRSMDLTRGRFHLSAADGSLEYQPLRLLAGRLDTVRFRRMTLRVEPEPGAEPGPSDTETTGPPQVPGPAAVFAALPARRLSVSTLELAVPALSFLAAGSLDVHDGRADLRLEASSPPRAARFALDARAGADGTLDLRVGERGSSGRPFVMATSGLDGNRLRARGELALRGFAFDLAAALAGVPPGDGSVGGTFSAEVPWPLPRDLDPAALTAALRLSGSWRARAGPWSVTDAEADLQLQDALMTGTLAGRVVYGEQGLQVRASAARVTLEGDAGDGELALSDGDGHPRVTVSWTLQPGVLTLAGDYRLEGPLLALAAEQTGVPGAGDLRGRISARLPWPLPDSLGELRPLAAEGSVSGRWRWDAGGIAASGLEGDWRFDAGRLAGTLAGVVSYGGLDLKAGLQLDHARLDETSFDADGAATLGTLVRVPFTVRHNPATSSGTLSAAGAASIDGPLAASIVAGWDRPYDVTGGKASVGAELQWEPAVGVGGTISLRLDGIGAYYQDYTVKGLSGAFVVSASRGTWTLPPSAVHVAELQTGVAVNDVESGIAWSGDVVSVQPTTGRLLGGTLRVAAFPYRLDGGDADLALQLAGLQLADVLALEGEHVTGAGTLDGTLPVRLRHHLPSVVDGRVRSAPPGGVIRVSPDLAAGIGQPGLDFALRALEDFRYTELESDVAYSETGDLTLDVHLQGRNPAIEDGRPIHYNLTVNENLPTLLRSLRLQGEVTRGIERRVKD